MGDQTNIMRQYMEAVSRRDFGKIRQLFHPQYSYTGSDGERKEGAEAGIAVAETYTGAFPDIKFEIKRTHAVDDDVLVTEFVVRATHQGKLMGIAPTGRKVEIHICNVIEVRDGKIYAEREYLDTAHVMQQLGVAAGPAHA